MAQMETTIREIQEKIEAAKQRSGRTQQVTLMAVTKTVDAARINEAISCGIRVIGENKAQELLEKYDALDRSTDIHFIGHLQKNKVKYIIDKVSLVHSVDSIALLEEIDRLAGKYEKIQDVLLQVNIAGDAAKFGLDPQQVEPVLVRAGELSHIRICGLMTIPFQTQHPEDNRQHYQKLHNLFVDIGLKTYHNVSMEFLSMGMSGDFWIAVEEGANIVRVGSRMFGRRDGK